MGTNMPQNRREALLWVESHAAAWNDNAAAIGLDPQTVATVISAAASARQDLTTSLAVRDASKGATQTWYGTADGMKDLASDAVLAIKAFAEASENPQAVYDLADISGASAPSPAEPPAEPTGLSATLNNNGQVELSWKGKGPAGTFYLVTRQLAGETSFAFLGDTTSKAFTDTTVPAGTASASYQVTARHTVNTVPGEPILVRFGVGGQGLASVAA
ncbi:MAG: hypothetical protein NCW75_06365 [Phycisphaera sp.]|nr:MAG: hypothetical protein NCW75_06365 [Phycisphaera sp.]